MADRESGKEFPDGLSPDNEDAASKFGRFRGWAALFVLGGLLLAALLGVFGGQKNQNHTAESVAGTLTINTPRILRSGEFFEMRMRVEADAAITKPVIAVPVSYWRDITVNTIEPQPASSGSEAGYFLYEFEALDPGDVIEWKIDGQINPTLFAGTQGTVQLRDDKAVLAQIPLKLRVFP